MHSSGTISRNHRAGEAPPASTPLLSPHRALRGLWVPFGLVETDTVSPGAKLTYGALAYFAGRDDHCWPSRRALAARLGVSVPQVTRYLQQLLAGGWIRRESHAGGTSTYRFLLHTAFTSSSPLDLDHIRSTPRITSDPPPGSHVIRTSIREVREEKNVTIPPSPPAAQGGPQARKNKGRKTADERRLDRVGEILRRRRQD